MRARTAVNEPDMTVPRTRRRTRLKQWHAKSSAGPSPVFKILTDLCVLLNDDLTRRSSNIREAAMRMSAATEEASQILHQSIYNHLNFGLLTYVVKIRCFGRSLASVYFTPTAHVTMTPPTRPVRATNASSAETTQFLLRTR